MSNPVWSGTLRVGQAFQPAISFAAKLFTGARAESAVSLSSIHIPDLSPMGTKPFCKLEDKSVPPVEVGKGYEYAKGQFLILNDAEIYQLAAPKLDLVDIAAFVPAAAIDPIYFESSYYLAPGDDGAEIQYAALYEALRRTQRFGLCWLNLYKRERPAILRAGHRGIIVHTLFFEREIRGLDEFRTDTSTVAIPVEVPVTYFDPWDCLTTSAQREWFSDRQRERTMKFLVGKITALIGEATAPAASESLPPGSGVPMAHAPAANDSKLPAAPVAEVPYKRKPPVTADTTRPKRGSAAR